MLKSLYISVALLAANSLTGALQSSKVRIGARLSEVAQELDVISGIQVSLHRSQVTTGPSGTSVAHLYLDAHTENRSYNLMIQEFNNNKALLDALEIEITPPKGRLPKGTFSGKSLGDECFHSIISDEGVDGSGLYLRSGLRLIRLMVDVRLQKSQPGAKVGSFLISKKELLALEPVLLKILTRLDSMPYGAKPQM